MQVLIQLPEYLLVSVCTEIRVPSASAIHEPVHPSYALGKISSHMHNMLVLFAASKALLVF